MGGTDGTLQLLEIIERQSVREAGHGRRAAVPAPRGGAQVQLPLTGPAVVAGPPPPTDPADAGSLHLQPGLAAGDDPRRSAPADAAPVDLAPAGAAPADGRSRARVLVAVAGIGLVVACWSGTSARLADRVPEGTTVAGTAIGGLDRADAVRAVARALQPRLDAPLPVTLAGASTGASASASAAADRTSGAASLDAASAGLTLDAAATVSRAIGPVGLPTTLWRQLRGGGAVEPVLETDPAQLAGALDRVSVGLDVPAVEGGISFATGAPVATEPVPGRAVDREAAADLVRRAWLAVPASGGPEAARPLVLPSLEVAPATTSAEVAAALAGQAQPAASGPLTVVVGDRSVVLAPAQVVPALSVVPAAGAAGGALQLHVDGEVLAAAVVAADPAVAVPAVDARVDTSSGAPVVVPATAGSEPDGDALAASAAHALVSGGVDRTARTATRPVAPDLTTEAVTAMGVAALLGQVVSPLTSDPARTTDVTLAARALDGVLVPPGGSLDVAALIGSPTAEAGYLPAGVLSQGRATTTTAAGSTQVASAVLAAAYAAGLQVDARTAPESWNPRDPAGLDAVVGPGAPLALSETGDTGALVRAQVVDGALRVQVWGGAGRTVSLDTATATDPRQAPQVTDGSPECVPQAGQDGFTTTVTRTTTATGADQPVVDQLTTTYAPRTAFTCTASAVPAGAAPTSLD